jgi:hypothetical protein
MTTETKLSPKSTRNADAPDGSEDPASRAKFDLHGSSAPRQLDSTPVPWGYGEDRITALVRSPDSLYLYWEITDAGIERARSRLGRAGAPEAGAWFNLRLYDTTGRHFDGTNANHYVDQRVDRAERDRFVAVGRPGSSLHAEIGVMTYEGYFQPIARSGRADFPRKSPSPDTSLEWMTVTSGEENPAAAPYHSRYAGPDPRGTGSHHQPPVGGSDARPASAPPPSTQVSTQTVTGTTMHAGPSQSWTVARSFTSEWVTRSPHDLSQIVSLPSFFATWQTQWSTDLRFLRWAGRWPGALPAAQGTGGGDVLAWQAGPFPLGPLDVLDGAYDPERVDVRMDGVAMVVPSQWGPIEIRGPWRVTVRGFETRPERRVLATWTMHWARVTPVVSERWITGVEQRRFVTHEHEEQVIGGSEALLLRSLGASEAWRLGASERMWLGASEWMLVGASEVLTFGASEAILSALALRGASEWLLSGASERYALGASEWLHAGASRGEAYGAAEMQGSSWLGSSETLFGDSSSPHGGGA